MSASPLPSSSAAGPLTSRQRLQVGLITGAALALYLGFRLLPTGTNLSHMDFRVGSGNSIEFCDPANPQFIPVVAARSPVTMTVLTSAPPTRGAPVSATLQLRTSSGKPLAPADLLIAHTRRLHLLVIDPTLRDYQHLHPEPGQKEGEWTFEFTPRAAGLYRVFADFTPVATNRGLYAHADLPVAAGAGAPAVPDGSAVSTGQPADLAVIGSGGRARVTADGYLYELATASGQPLKAGQVADLHFGVSRSDGGAVSLAPVMDAFAHLVAFDEARGGFAHLHPAETDLQRPPDAVHPALSFKVTIPTAGRYVIWAQLAPGGHERFVPFAVTVE